MLVACDLFAEIHEYRPSVYRNRAVDSANFRRAGLCSVGYQRPIAFRQSITVTARRIVDYGDNFTRSSAVERGNNRVSVDFARDSYAVFRS